MRASRSRSGRRRLGMVPAEPNGRWWRAGTAIVAGRMSERRWRVLGCGRGLFAIEVDDGGGFRAATTAEVYAALLRQRELFGAAEYPVQRVGPDDRDDVDVG